MARIFAPSCTVVIPTRNRPDCLHECLEAATRLVYPHFDVLVVDNDPRDERAREVAARWNARYVREPVIGLSRARNRGARACDTEIVAYLDDDGLPEPSWLSALAVEFQDPQVMAVTGKVEGPGGESDSEGLSTWVGLSRCGGTEKRAVDRQTPFWFEIANFGGIGVANMALRRSAFSVWPGFHERLGLGTPIQGFEEHYAFFSLVHRGYRVTYTPHAVLRHPNPMRASEDAGVRYLQVLAASTGYLTLLFFEEPRYRMRVVRYAAEGFFGKRRVWRDPVPTPMIPDVPRWRRAVAYLSGPVNYARVRLQGAPPAMDC